MEIRAWGTDVKLRGKKDALRAEGRPLREPEASYLDPGTLVFSLPPAPVPHRPGSNACLSSPKEVLSYNLTIPIDSQYNETPFPLKLVE